MSSVFGQIFIADDLENAAVNTLESWFPVYIREVELQSPAPPDPRNIPQDALPLPRAYITAERLDRENADQLPAIVVVSPGLGRKIPMQEGDGTFRVTFSLAIGVFVSGQDRMDTKRLLRLYTGMARTIILQHQSLGGYSDGATWLDESYDDNFNFNDTLTLGCGQVVFEIDVAEVVSRYGGPAAYGQPEPPPDPTQPGSTWPEVETVTAEIEIMEEV